MKRILLFLLLITGTIFLSGCELPEEKVSSDKDNTVVQENTAGNNEREVKDQENADDDNEPDEPVEDESPEKPTIQVNLYYQDADGYIVPVTRKLAKQEGIARAAINCLIDSSLNREEVEYYGLYPVLPKGTSIRGLTIRDGTAVIDFSSELLNYDSKRAEINIISSVVYTLTEFNTVQNVKILVDGRQKDKLKFDTDISKELNRQNVLINSDRINLRQDMKKFDVYFYKVANERFSYILPVSEETSGTGNDAIISEIIARLGEDPEREVLVTELPKGTRLIGSSIEADTVTLNISRELTDYGGNAREEGILNQILFSMGQIEGVSKVKILIAGEATTLPEGTDLTHSMTIPSAINNYIDK